jgi:hypothetical protein
MEGATMPSITDAFCTAKISHFYLRTCRAFQPEIAVETGNRLQTFAVVVALTGRTKSK